MLKLDLDSFECDILELIIVKEGYRPRVIISEASPAWPPPLRFRMNYNDGWFAATAVGVQRQPTEHCRPNPTCGRSAGGS